MIVLQITFNLVVFYQIKNTYNIQQSKLCQKKLIWWGYLFDANFYVAADIIFRSFLRGSINLTVSGLAVHFQLDPKQFTVSLQLRRAFNFFSAFNF